jgi:hypothetical protein
MQLDIEEAARRVESAMYEQIADGEVEAEPTNGGTGVEIFRLMAGAEGRGDGTSAMRAAADLADSMWLRLTLKPDGSYYEDEQTAAREPNVQ